MDDELSELTLSVMANRTKYDKCKKNIAQSTPTIQDTFQKEKLYYKDRILHMTRDLFHERCENETINDAHQEYLKSCIEYLKWNDITEMVDGDTRNEVRCGEVTATQYGATMELTDARAAVERRIRETVVDSHDGGDNGGHSPPPAPRLSSGNSNNDILSIANKMCIRKKTIDDFIILKPTARPDDNEINSRLPKIRDYHNEIAQRADAAAAAAANSIATISTTPTQ